MQGRKQNEMLSGSQLGLTLERTDVQNAGFYGLIRHSGPWFLLLTLYVRAILAVRRGNPDEAIAPVREGLIGIRELHDKFEFVYALVPLAGAAVLKGDDVWAAQILGARDAVTESTGATVVDKSVHDLREQAEQGVRASLGPDQWARAYSAGRRTPNRRRSHQSIPRPGNGRPRERATSRRSRGPSRSLAGTTGPLRITSNGR